MLECDPKGGHIVWLENPGRDKLKDGGLWKEHYVGRWPAMHRIKIGHFTQKSFLEIVAASFVYGAARQDHPIPILRFQQPQKVAEATEWPCEVIDDENFTIIHELTPRKLDGPGRPRLADRLESRRNHHSGVQPEARGWDRKVVGMGEPKEPWQTPDSSRRARATIGALERGILAGWAAIRMPTSQLWIHSTATRWRSTPKCNRSSMVASSGRGIALTFTGKHSPI
ncbi:hypothetical protein PG997_012947 [Apiospora hydei]|uniref:Aldos-2-ulose dehydratase beta-propeller domain-containing protein n=1 Tax=Apiospora hydei TaxID=1337664 RepID=A0ABR1V7F8_9PEZI